jgi:hypothetical protein
MPGTQEQPQIAVGNAYFDILILNMTVLYFLYWTWCWYYCDLVFRKGLYQQSGRCKRAKISAKVPRVRAGVNILLKYDKLFPDEFA